MDKWAGGSPNRGRKIHHIAFAVGIVVAAAAGFDHTHAKWGNVLETHVNANGYVAYGTLKSGNTDLEAYLEELRSVRADEIGKWSRPRQMAFWINAYNALTVELILKHYPLKSIRDIKKPWDQTVLRLGKRGYSLNDIEHKILRKDFPDPRVHVAVVCASVGCPPLQRYAFTGAGLEEQLDQAARAFVRDPVRNKINPEKGAIRVSEIFKWYKGDFEASGGVAGFVAKYAPKEKAAEIRKARVKYFKYDWSLNEQGGQGK